jgi:phenylpropionate dioxygenase-like ring-hydroxylating dioxygenase large terminal subunit
MIDGFPYRTFPTGWFQVAWSGQIEPGQTLALKFWDEHLVAYRGESGAVHVMEAFCKHLGAHLAHGGVVEGDSIRCPFHGWCWAPNGRNTDIPYSKRKKLNISQRIYPVRELHGLVFVWYDADGGEPTWEPPNLLEKHGEGHSFFDLWPQSTCTDRLRMQPLMMVENSVDFAHLVSVHRWVGESRLEGYEADGHYFMGRVSGTIMTPKGESPTIVTEHIYGQGLIVGTMDSGVRFVAIVACVTPIDHDYSQVQLSILVSCPQGADPAQLDGLGKAIVAAQREEVLGLSRGDRKIWENQRYIAAPPLPAEEHGGVRAVREWSAQFYSSGKGVSVDA